MDRLNKVMNIRYVLSGTLIGLGFVILSFTIEFSLLWEFNNPNRIPENSWIGITLLLTPLISGILIGNRITNKVAKHFGFDYDTLYPDDELGEV